MALTIGKRQYPNRSYSTRVYEDIQQKIFLVDSDIASVGYLAFSNRLPTRKTMTEKVEWDTDELSARTDTLNGAVSSTTQTTITVDNPTYFIPSEYWINTRSEEIVGISSVDYENSQLSVIRGFAGSTAAAMSDGDTLAKIGSYAGEDSTRMVTRTTTPTSVYNYCQQMRKDLAMTSRQIKRAWKNGEAEFPYQSMKALKEFRIDLANAYLFSKRSRDTVDGDDVTTMNGLRPVITTNTYAVDGVLYKNLLDDFLVDEGFRYGSQNKILFCSTDVIKAFTSIVDQNLSFQTDISAKKGVSFGVTVGKYLSPSGGELMLVHDRNISNYFPGEAYGVDMSQLSRVEFSNNGISGAMHVLTHTEDADDIGRTDTIFGDQCITYGYEPAHFKLTGVSGGSYAASAE